MTRRISATPAPFANTVVRGCAGLTVRLHSCRRQRKARAADLSRFESDVCIIGAGISAAMLAQKLSELKPALAITVVEAGRSLFDVENRMAYRKRFLDYG